MKHLKSFFVCPKIRGSYLSTVLLRCSVSAYIANTNSQLAVTLRLNVTLNNLRITRFKLTRKSNCLLDSYMNSCLGSGLTGFQGNSDPLFARNIKPPAIFGSGYLLNLRGEDVAFHSRRSVLMNTNSDRTDFKLRPAPSQKKKYVFVNYLITLHQIEMKWQYAYGEQEISQSFKGILRSLLASYAVPIGERLSTFRRAIMSLTSG